MKTIQFGGEELLLDPDRAVVWYARNVLVVTDTHFGKDATARALGMPAPSGALGTDLKRLAEVAARHATKEIWILGDVFDSAAAGIPETIQAIRSFLKRTPVTLSMVPGNHDRNLRAVAEAAGIRWLPSDTLVGPLSLAHEPLTYPAEHPRLCGHLHPGTILRGPGRDRLNVPCFWLRDGQLILPAFGTWTGLALIQRQPRDHVWATAAGRVIECPATATIRRANRLGGFRPSLERDLD